MWCWYALGVGGGDDDGEELGEIRNEEASSLLST
jgi:hypothetical protein